MRRLPVLLLSAATTLLVLAPSALANTSLDRPGHDGGQGWIGEANDVIITNAGFLVIGAIPLFIFLMSLLQWSLDRRKARRKALKLQLDEQLRTGW